MQVYEKVKSGTIAPEQVVEEFQKKYKDHDFEMIFGSDDEYDTSRKVSFYKYLWENIGLSLKITTTDLLPFYWC